MSLSTTLYHHRLLADAWPGPMNAFADECDRIGELLGDDHDLATLAELLSSPGEDPAPPSVDIDRILDLIVARRAELSSKALEHGRRVYAEKPKAFKRRLGAYVAAARSGRREPQAA